MQELGEKRRVEFDPGRIESAESRFVPNLYCVGAPKSVTSFIYSILREHPKVFVAERDTGMISLYLAYEHGSHDLGEQAARFLHASNTNYAGQCAGQPVLGNFEVGYFSHDRGADYLARFLEKDTRILLFLRDPIKRLVSEYTMRVRQHDKLIGGFVERHDFDEALLLESKRAEQEWTLQKQYYSYVGNSQYYAHVKSYFDTFGPDNVRVFIAEEDVSNNLSRTLHGLFAFLGIRDSDSVRVSYMDHSTFREISRSPRRIDVSFHLADASTVDDAATAQELVTARVERLEISSDVPMQLSL